MEQTIEQAKAMKGVQHPTPLRISRGFHARRETVFKAWSTAEHVTAWFCPDVCHITDAKVEMRVGGTFDLCMHGPGFAHWIRGRFVEVVPDQRLAIEMVVTDTAGTALFSALTEVDFSDALCGTQMDVVQTYTFVDPAMAAPMVAGAQEGWRQTLDKLEREVVQMQGGSGMVARSVVHATFHLERTYDAPAARVWKALTDETAKAKWFAGAPGRWELIERFMDVRPGGRERLEGRWEGGVVSRFDAVYHDVVPIERLVYAYEMHMDDKKISVSLATLQLKAEGAKTRLTITEQGAFLDGYDDAGSREQGTGLLLDAIGASLKD